MSWRWSVTSSTTVRRLPRRPWAGGTSATEAVRSRRRPASSTPERSRRTPCPQQRLDPHRSRSAARATSGNVAPQRRPPSRSSAASRRGARAARFHHSMPPSRSVSTIPWVRCRRGPGAAPRCAGSCGASRSRRAPRRPSGRAASRDLDVVVAERSVRASSDREGALRLAPADEERGDEPLALADRGRGRASGRRHRDVTKVARGSSGRAVGRRATTVRGAPSPESRVTTASSASKTPRALVASASRTSDSRWRPATAMEAAISWCSWLARRWDRRAASRACRCSSSWPTAAPASRPTSSTAAASSRSRPRRWSVTRHAIVPIASSPSWMQATTQDLVPSSERHSSERRRSSTSARSASRPRITEASASSRCAANVPTSLPRPSKSSTSQPSKTSGTSAPTRWVSRASTSSAGANSAETAVARTSGSLGCSVGVRVTTPPSGAGGCSGASRSRSRHRRRGTPRRGSAGRAASGAARSG